MNDIPISRRLQKEPVVCPLCGSAWRVRRGLCLSCLLSQGLRAEIHNDERLDDVPGEIDIREPD
jgi:hypothetical protein